MGQVRIEGLVRSADRVRRELTAPLSAERLGALRAYTADCLAAVDRVLASHRLGPEALPPPSQKAYRFLAGIDFDALRPDTAPPPCPGGAESIAYPGLKRDMERLWDSLACPGPQDAAALARFIRCSSEQIEADIAASGILPWQLTAATRALRGWLRFFAIPDNFRAYRAAVDLARRALEPGLAGQARFRPPALVQFRPLTGVYRLRGGPGGSRLQLPTPMIGFDAALFRSLAGLALGRHRDKQPVLEAMTGEDYQDLQGELDALGGVVEQPKGVCHDLDAAFRRVDTAYFRGTVARPRLAWSRSFTHRKFGHYDPVGDTVMVSSSLDRADVPALAVDFVVYHELLHKKHGVRWENGRARVHTPGFKAEERRFRGMAEAEAVLLRLAGGRA